MRAATTEISVIRWLDSQSNLTDPVCGQRAALERDVNKLSPGFANRRSGHGFYSGASRVLVLISISRYRVPCG